LPAHSIGEVLHHPSRNKNIRIPKKIPLQNKKVIDTFTEVIYKEYFRFLSESLDPAANILYKDILRWRSSIGRAADL
jgi:hypothetical protein